MDLSAVRSICTCEHCGKFYESPIKLPCFNTICLAHLNELLKNKSKNVIHCCFCKKDHQIPANGFERYAKIDEIIQSKSHLYEDEKEFALFIETSTRKIKELNTELDSKQPDILEIVIKRLSNLRNQIELDAARHKKNIDLECGKIVKKLDLFQEKCIKSINETYKIQNEQFLKELNEKFNEFKCSPKFDDEQIKSLKKNVEKSLKVMEKKLLHLDRVKESVINLSYKSNILRINGICFGKIEEKHRSFKIITSSYDNTIGFWENETCLQTLMQHDMTRSLEVYNSKLLITGLKAEIKFWNIDDNMSLLKTVSELNLGYVSCLLATLDGDLIAGFGNGTIKIFNLKTFVCVKTLKDHLSHVWCIILFGSDKFISSSSDRKINIWDMETGKCEKSFKNNDSVNCLALYGNNIISGDDNGEISLIYSNIFI